MAKTYKVRRLHYRRRNPGGSNIVGFVLLGVGAYLLYKWWTTPAAGATATTGTGAPLSIPGTNAPGVNTTVSNPVQPTTTTTGTVATQPPPTITSDVANKMYAALNMTPIQTNGQPTVLNMDQWLWAYQNVTGVSISPSVASTMDATLQGQGMSRTTPISLVAFGIVLFGSIQGMHGIDGLGLGRVYASGYGGIGYGGMVGLGAIGQGYNINALRDSNATWYERANKWVM